MASIARQSMLKQAWASAPSKQLTSFRAAASLASANAWRQPASSIILRNAVPVAGFHASGRRAILPPLPQRVNGSVNDPAPVPAPHPFHGSYHWTFERLVSAGLIPLTLAPFIGGSLNPLTDSILGATILIHSYIGFQACIIDYFPSYRVPKIQNALMWVLRVATVLTGIGFYEFETNDVGITQAIARIWKA
ncbi:uncharacterized protein PV09_00549 [Verruconis gallopava]|uniref:Succinate dehydrogenase [ubiquinone] cytochrome b small subunit n=1 Tax=Verruconis gallopava TaxID=253628 RepID=A0A0D1Y0K6_9PEZI|nr:uncharacterized protein PV09_00549 [Verruconis gallopava]KIW08586.1 hypothetical protein PV09_00549 [Verruconis gallopava]